MTICVTWHHPEELCQKPTTSPQSEPSQFPWKFFHELRISFFKTHLPFVAVKLDPRVLEELHTVLSIHVLREIELEVELKKIISWDNRDENGSGKGDHGKRILKTRWAGHYYAYLPGANALWHFAISVEESQSQLDDLQEVHIAPQKLQSKDKLKRCKVKTSWMIFNQEQWKIKGYNLKLIPCLLSSMNQCIGREFLSPHFSHQSKF